MGSTTNLTRLAVHVLDVQLAGAADGMSTLEACRMVRKACQAAGQPVLSINDLADECKRIVALRSARKEARELPFVAPWRDRWVWRRYQIAQQAWRACGYRVAQGRWAGGDHRDVITFNASFPSARGESKRVWSDNRKWRGNDSVHYVNLCPAWYLTVHRPGLAVINGRFTLAASPMAPDSGAELWDITQAVQARGFDIDAKHCVAARRDGVLVTAGTVAGALRKLVKAA